MICDLKCMWFFFLNLDFGCLVCWGIVVLFGGVLGCFEFFDIGVFVKGFFYVIYGVNFYFVEDLVEYN